MRLATSLLSLALVLISGVTAQSLPGYLAQGTVTLTGPRGHQIRGTITVSEAAPGYCAITIQLGSPILPRRYTAVMNGSRIQITGPAGLLRSAPLPLRPGSGCVLLPVGRTAAERLVVHGQAIVLGYTSASVIESIGGSVRLTAAFSSIKPHTFVPSDFAPPPQAVPPVRAGGAQ